MLHHLGDNLHHHQLLHMICSQVHCCQVQVRLTMHSAPFFRLHQPPPLLSHNFNAAAVKQSKTVKKGSKLPIDDAAKLLMLDDKNEPHEVNFKELIQGKKVVIFGLPGEAVLGGGGSRR